MTRFLAVIEAGVETARATSPDRRRLLEWIFSEGRRLPGADEVDPDGVRSMISAFAEGRTSGVSFVVRVPTVVGGEHDRTQLIYNGRPVYYCAPVRVREVEDV